MKEAILNNIKEEQDKYQPTMTVEEMAKIVEENDEKIGMKPLSLEETNQYIQEVRNGNRCN